MLAIPWDHVVKFVLVARLVSWLPAGKRREARSGRGGRHAGRAAYDCAMGVVDLDATGWRCCTAAKQSVVQSFRRRRRGCGRDRSDVKVLVHAYVSRSKYMYSSISARLPTQWTMSGCRRRVESLQIALAAGPKAGDRRRTEVSVGVAMLLADWLRRTRGSHWFRRARDRWTGSRTIDGGQ